MADPVADPREVSETERRPSPDTDETTTVRRTVERARRDAHAVIAATTNHPDTVNEWADTTLVGLVVRLFERNEEMRLLLHTTDRALARATRVVVPEYGYYDLTTRTYPPRTVRESFPRRENFVW